MINPIEDIQVGLELDFSNEQTLKWRNPAKFTDENFKELITILECFLNDPFDKNTTADGPYLKLRGQQDKVVKEELQKLLKKSDTLVKFIYKTRTNNTLEINITVDYCVIEIVIVKNKLSTIRESGDFINDFIYQKACFHQAQLTIGKTDMNHLNIDWKTGFKKDLNNVISEILKSEDAKEQEVKDKDVINVRKINAPLVSEILENADDKYEEWKTNLAKAKTIKDNEEKKKTLIASMTTDIADKWKQLVTGIIPNTKDNQDQIAQITMHPMHYRAINIEHLLEINEDLQRVEFRRYMAKDNFHKVLNDVQNLLYDFGF